MVAPRTPQSIRIGRSSRKSASKGSIQPGPAYPGVMGPTNIFAAPFLLMASAKTTDEAAYQVAKAIYENKKKLVTTHNAFNGLQQKDLNINVGIAYHPGAKKFFAEKGM